MTLAGLISEAATPPGGDPALPTMLSAVGAATPAIWGPWALQPLAVATLAGPAGRTVLAVTSTAREADDLLESLQCLLPADSVALYPGWETLPHERLSPRADTIGRRLAVLRRLRHPDAADAGTGPLKVVVARVRSVLQPQVPNLGDLEPVSIAIGDSGRELADI